MNELDDLPLTPQEERMAKLAYARWEQSEAESMAEYARRRRTVDLASLVVQVMADELTDTEQAFLRLRYYDCLTPSEIAQQRSINKATVTRTLARAEERVRRYLRYVVAYQYDIKNVSFLPVAVRAAMVTAGARYGTAKDLSTRLRSARLSENLSVDTLSAAVQIPAQRLTEMEDGTVLPDARELLALSLFYDIPADCLLKGESA